MDRPDLRVETALVPVSQAAPPAVPATELVERASRTVLGVVLIVIDGLSHIVERASEEQAQPPLPGGPGAGVTTRRVAVGLAFESQRRVLDGLDAAARVVGPSVRWIAGNSLVRRLAAPLERRLDAAYEVGLAEEEKARTVAGRSGEEAVQLAVPVVLERVDVDLLVGQVLGEIDMKPVIDQVMGEIDLPELVERVMGELDLSPIVQRVLDDLDLNALVNEVVGEMQMSSVVMKATGGMADDVLGEVRNRSADGDALVEQIVAKVLRRRLRETPGTAAVIDEAST